MSLFPIFLALAAFVGKFLCQFAAKINMLISRTFDDQLSSLCGGRPYLGELEGIFSSK